MRRAAVLTALYVCACAATPPPPPDAGDDAGVIIPPTPCTLPQDCRLAHVAGVCRQGECRAQVPCGDDLECGLGERCVQGACAFTGCTTNTDCPTHKCLVDTFTCVECTVNADCPRERPVCDGMHNTCVSCNADSQCTEPGPAHCSAGGGCVHCTRSEHCPNGLSCSGGVCVGAQLGNPCPTGTACAAGLVCVSVNGGTSCLTSCELYAPQCSGTQICYKLTYSGSTSLVFESHGPIGVCFDSQAGARNLREACARTASGSNCQPNLACIPESSQVSLCRGYCNPNASGTCPAGETCTTFVGDGTGRRYGLCLPDTGFGELCEQDRDCRSNLTCQAWDDPSATEDISHICGFNVGSQPGLAPCAATRLTDGGVVSADRACQSGACEADSRSPGAPYFCYSACQADTDCQVGARSGTCDGLYTFTTASMSTGSLKGCVPSCTSEASCAEYDAGVTCRLRLTLGSTPVLKPSCSPPPVGGVRRAGEPCTQSVQCRSGYCWLEDARGTSRFGTCMEGCTTSADCSAGDAGLPVRCQRTTLLGSRGNDGVAQTGDDKFLTPTLCSGAPCSTNVDCQGDAGVAVCVPDVDPLTAGMGQVVLRCRAPAVGVKHGGDTCASDSECVSGVCGSLQPPSVGSGKTCFEACVGATVCPGSTVCRVGGMQVPVSGGPATVDSCAP